MYRNHTRPYYLPRSLFYAPLFALVLLTAAWNLTVRPLASNFRAIPVVLEDANLPPISSEVVKPSDNPRVGFPEYSMNCFSNQSYYGSGTFQERLSSPEGLCWIIFIFAATLIPIFMVRTRWLHRASAKVKERIDLLL